MSKVETDIERFNQARAESAAEHQRMIEAVDAYLQSQVTENENKEDILEKYFHKYKDFLDLPPIEPLKTAKRMEHLKRAIYMHEIRPKEKEAEKEKGREDIQKAA